MNKIKPQIIVFFLLLSIPIHSLNALTAVTNGDSRTYESHGGGCLGNENGCYGMNGNFELRLTLVTSDRKRVPGTVSVNIAPTQESKGETQHIETNYYSREGVEAVSNIRRLNPYQDENIYVYGSTLAKTTLPEDNLDTMNYTYMGFGKTDPETISIGNYNNLNRKFLSYAKNLNQKENITPETGEKVSFVDYFLKMCGFSNTWNTSNNIEELKKFSAEETGGEEYYILIEPIYTVYAKYENHNHSITGTSKELAGFAGGAGNNMDYICSVDPENCIMFGATQPNYFLSLYDKNLVQNYACNIIDQTNINFEYTETTFENGQPKLETKVINVYDFCDRELPEKGGYGDVFYKISQPSGMGSEQINLSQLFKSNTNISSCNYNISLCENDNYKFSAYLSSTILKDLKINENSQNPSEIYRCLNNLDSNEKRKYIYSVGDENNGIMCYDNVEYDFSEIKNELMKKDKFSAGTLLNIPSGILNVHRTCYLKRVPEGDMKTTLTNLLYDEIEENTKQSIYQSEFVFNFNGKEYEYKRNSNIKIDDASLDEIEQELNNPTAIKKEHDITAEAYIYTSDFSYEYNIINGLEGNDFNINIIDYSIAPGIINTNSIKFITMNESKTILLSTNNSGEYTNSITKQLNNAYGLSTKAINGIKENGRISTENSENVIKGKFVVDTTKSSTISSTIQENRTCDFKTNLVNNDVLGDGVIFRVISLNNPFPARDGTSRLPGKNWLNATENNVYDYITNNRNIQDSTIEELVNPEKIYSEKEPLYIIELDSQTIAQIREYNKTHNYKVFNITCLNGKGRECVSDFLRSSEIFKNKSLSGSCSGSPAKELNDVMIGTKNEVRNEQYYKKQCSSVTNKTVDGENCIYKSEVDLDKNGIIDSKDLDMLDEYISIGDIYLNQENYYIKGNVINDSYFYTCADKTVASGG